MAERAPFELLPKLVAEATSEIDQPTDPRRDGLKTRTFNCSTFELAAQIVAGAFTSLA